MECKGQGSSSRGRRKTGNAVTKALVYDIFKNRILLTTNKCESCKVFRKPKSISAS